MTPHTKQLNLLGLAQRANALVSGDEQVEKAIKKGKVKLIILANDVSEKTLARYQAFSETYKLPLNSDFNKIEISQAIGKSRAILGLTNAGMSKKFLSYVTGVENMNDK